MLKLLHGNLSEKVENTVSNEESKSLFSSDVIFDLR